MSKIGWALGYLHILEREREIQVWDFLLGWGVDVGMNS